MSFGINFRSFKVQAAKFSLFLTSFQHYSARFSSEKKRKKRIGPNISSVLSLSTLAAKTMPFYRTELNQQILDAKTMPFFNK